MSGSRVIRAVLLAAVVIGPCGRADARQLGTLLSPGPLSKAHEKLAGARNCSKCHEPTSRVMVNLCLTCHKPVAERIARKAGVHRDAGQSCSPCHVEHRGPNADLLHLDRATFDHERETGYGLGGLHSGLAAACDRCHKTRSFLGLSTSCGSCHADSHKPSLGADCSRCHSITVSFKQSRTQFDHGKTAYPLAGSHRRLDCARCHVNKVYKGLRFALCADCHRSPHRRIFDDPCSSCHTPETWQTRKFDHGRTAYALKGRHASVDCVKCHVKPPARAALRFDRCDACHQDPHRGTFKQDCSGCHNETAFARAKFSHDTSTKFALTGAHAPLACSKCHKNAPRVATVPVRVVEFRGLSALCASCHADVHRAELGAACDTCHTSATFKLPAYRHQQDRAFFAGRHQSVSCTGCHVSVPPGSPRSTTAPIQSWSFRDLKTACSTCHLDVHLGQVGASCESCHLVDSPKFTPVTFAHGRSSFKLTGKHETVACRKCHKIETGVFPAGSGTAVRLKGLRTACATCHEDQHLGQLGPKCETCHTTRAFTLPGYKHVGRVDFFVARHATEKCASCHKLESGAFPAGLGRTIRYKGVGASCSSCHPDQHGGAMGQTCETCHSPAAWATISRAFHKSAVFPLEGRHLTTDCASCHLGGVIKGTPVRCADCHWVRRQDDRYRTRLGERCEDCHKPTSWTAVNWSHATMTGFALSAAHRAVACDGCHRTQAFTLDSVACVSCHNGDYRDARQPNHVSAGFPTSCETCHLPADTSWKQASFNHQSIFGLVGPHATQPCSACHRSGVYQGTPRECYGCHKDDYDRSKNPGHAAAGFPTACESCHSASASDWHAAFSHSAVFQLVGVHATQACAACHKNGVYRGTPRDCYGCHKADYDGSLNPKHAAAGFPTTCDSCHSASASDWHASFNHNAVYPLLGRHLTAPCSACHQNNVYHGTPRDCYPCHQAQYSATTNPNHAAAGFPTTCASCHNASDASWSLGRFSHTWFPIASGRHANITCSTCHVTSGNYQAFSCLSGCHPKTDTDNKHKGRAGYRYDSAACYSCHPTGKG